MGIEALVMEKFVIKTFQISAFFSKVIMIYLLLNYPLQAIAKTKVFYLTTPYQVSTLVNVEKNVTQAYNNIGYQVEIVRMPAKRALHEANISQWVDGELARVEIAGKVLKNHIKIPIPLYSIEIYGYALNE